MGEEYKREKSLPLPALFLEFQTSKSGLSQAEASLRLNKFGKNQIAEPKKISRLALFVSQFNGTVQFILFAAALLSLVLGHTNDAIAIFFAILLSGSIGFVQELRSENAFEYLNRLTIQKVRLRRSGYESLVDSPHLVPGDVLVLEEGMRIPADIRIFESIEISVNESTLTGESVSVEKSAAPNSDNILYAGTILVSGRGEGVVISTGMNTSFGKIAALVSASEKDQTPLQKNLNEFGKKMGYLVVLLAFIFFVVGLFVLHRDLIDVLTTSVILAVAGVSEGLPTVIAITLALGMQDMAKRNALVKKMTAIEDLGLITCICTDKTGTLTLNTMSPKFAYCPGSQILDFSKIPPKPLSPFESLFNCAVLANSANLDVHGKAIGDPTEGGLLLAASLTGLDISKIRLENPKIHENKFDSHRKLMSVVCESETRSLYVKGAPEILLGRCSSFLGPLGITKMNEKSISEFHTVLSAFASKGMRVLAFASSELSLGSHLNTSLENNLIFLGFICLYDPPRPEVSHALSLCKTAGIDVFMVTGDSKDTAINIAKEVGFENVHSMSGHEFESLNPTARKTTLKTTRIFYRVSPAQKYLIVSEQKNNGQIVAVTGDGVNDAPALKKSDVGIVMGITGSDVAKDSAVMVLLDDNFVTIITAVEYGRKIYDNILNFIRFQITTTISLLSTVFVASVFGFPEPLLPIQMLFINLIMDGPPALALGMEPTNEDVMKNPPRDPKRPYIDSPFLSLLALNGFFICVGMLILLFFLIQAGYSPSLYLTMSFVTMVLFQLLHSLNCRSTKEPFYKNLLSNPMLCLSILGGFIFLLLFLYVPSLSIYMHTVPLSISDFAICLLCSLTILVFEEVRKRVGLFSKI
ncbi:cation-transporting P-type ATPase [Candidatus Micrarchaeota archaeon]|nr:cation-transporting P-type ATPase [Candidatus Micrarchaeota archaeon]